MFRWSLLILPVLLALPVRAQEDPESSPEGRSEYLGREIARTMHWTGADWLLRATRESEENGTLLREWLAVEPGEAVCDFGCGNGYHSLPLAEAVGPEGRLYAVDLQVPMLAMLRDRLGEAGLKNAELVEAGIDDPHLPPASCDLVLMVDVYHELSHPVRVLGHVRRALKPGGRLVLVEFRAEDRSVPIRARHKMSKAQVVREMAANGFAWVDEHDGLPWQHVLSFTPVEDAGGRFEEGEVLQAFWRSVAAGRPDEVRAFLAPKVDGGRKRLDQAADLIEEFTELLSDVGAERWPALREGWRLSQAEGTLLARKEGAQERVGLVRGGDGALRVDCWRMRAAPYQGHLVAMNTGTGRGTPEEQVDLISKLGYGGIGWGIWRTAEVRAHCEARGMDLWSVYSVLDVAKDPDPREEQLALAMAALADGPGQVWLALENSGREASDPEGDAEALRTITRVLALADEHGVEVALYPHYGSWMERVEDVERLLAESDHPGLGLCFNVCHWLRNHGDAAPAPVLGRLRRRLLAVTVNGAERGGTSWTELIQPLDVGDFDQAGFLELLGDLRFDGPIGLQGFGIKLAPEEHLARSIETWRKLGGR